RMLTSPAALASFRWMSSSRTIHPSAGRSAFPLLSFMGALSHRARRRRRDRHPGGGYGVDALCVNAMAAAGLLLALLSAPSAMAAEPLRILAFGDSLTAGFGLPDADGFVPQLQSALADKGISVRVTNAGVSGDTTAGGLARLDWSLADDPQLVIVELGANDGLRGL